MATVFRLAQKRYKNQAFSGEGAIHAPGRWHDKGHEVVYTASSRALAILEILAQTDAEEMPDYFMVPADIPKTIFGNRRIIQASALPKNWRTYPSPPALQIIGSGWIQQAKELVLEIPSVIVPEEPNYLLNPAHPDFKKTEIGKPQTFTFDPRILKK
jgi:RES domain-containing protein